jgi:hypothetical protein
MSKRKYSEKAVEPVEGLTVENCEETVGNAVETGENSGDCGVCDVEIVQQDVDRGVCGELEAAKEELAKLTVRVKYLRALITDLSGQKDQPVSKMARAREIMAEMSGAARKQVIQRFMADLPCGKAYGSTLYALIKKGK